MFLLKTPGGEKIKKQTYSCDDISSLKYIMRNLNSKNHTEKIVQYDV
jgi:hypothetical protein